jgi:strawberry notch-like protein
VSRRSGLTVPLAANVTREAGKADTAIQGLGRSIRTNQAQPPLFRAITTSVQEPIRSVTFGELLCFAPTRSGKGVGLVIPTFLT